MIGRTFKGLIQLLGGLAAGLAIVLSVAAWQLSKGPISLGFLSPYIENAVNTPEREFRLRLENTILTWAGWERTLDIRILNVRVLGPGGSLIGSIPEASFSLSGAALVQGRLAPRTIELFGPKLLVRRDRDGSFEVGFGEDPASSRDVAANLLDQLSIAPEEEAEQTYLTRLDILGADVTIIDQMLKKSWHVPATDVHLLRDAGGMRGAVSMVVDVDGRQTELEIDGAYRADSRQLDAVAEFSEVSPAAFSSVFQELEPLRAFELPFKGRLTVSMTIDGDVETVGFDLTGGQGQLVLPAPFAQSMAVEEVSVRGSYYGEDEIIAFDEVAVDLGEDGRLQLPSPIDHEMPVRSVRVESRYFGATGRLTISKLEADLRGPTVSLSAVLDGVSADSDSIDIEVKGDGGGFLGEDLKKYWPRSLGTDAWEWSAQHLSDGLIEHISAEARLRWSSGRYLRIVRVDGTMDLSGVSVDYLPPMPRVRDASAHIRFNEQVFDIAVEGGRSRGLEITRGNIRITGLDEFDQYANIDLSIAGDLRSKLKYINHRPLGFARAIGIDPAEASGAATTKLKLRFIAEHALTLDQIEVSAQSTLRGVSLGNIFLGRGIHDSRLSMQVDKAGMVMTGAVKIGKIPARLSWRENFTDAARFKSRYDLSATIADIQHLSDLGLDLEPFSGDYIKGAIGADIRFTVVDDIDRRLEVSADISKASLVAPAFGWHKEEGVKGNAEIVMDLKRALVSDVPRFSVEAADLKILGSANYAADGTGLERIDFKRVAFGRTNLKGALIPKADGTWEADFRGPTLDLSAIWDEVLERGGDEEEADTFVLPNFRLTIDVARVWLGLEESVSGVYGRFAREDDFWRSVQLESRLSSGGDFELAITPQADGNRKFRMTSDDAGGALKLLGYYDNMVGGKLDINGVYDDASPGQPLTGVVSVDTYRIIDAPLLTHVLSIMALTGILDALQGEGLAFSSLEIPFVHYQGAVKLRDAKATGASLGFTASGTVYTHADVLDIEGTVVPAYALNSALGHIPLLGDILTGSEEGGGVFAANFSMAGPTEEPRVSVNPLSALTPGILRNVFGMFGDAGAGAGLTSGEDVPIGSQ